MGDHSTQSPREALADWFVREVRERGLVDLKTFPTTDTSATVEDCAAAILAAVTAKSNPRVIPCPSVVCDGGYVSWGDPADDNYDESECVDCGGTGFVEIP